MKRIAAFAGLVALAGYATPASAGPANADRCAQAAEDGQKLRDDRKLRGARDKFLECGSEACPVVVRRDCVRWKAELDAAIPTLVVRAVDKRGRDVSGAKLVIDGTTVKDRIDGSSVPVDPGEHTVSIVATSGPTAEQRVVVAQGERDRVITITFEATLDTDGSALATSSAPPIGAPPANEKSYVLPIFLGGAAVLSLGVFTAFDLTAWSKYKDLENGCGATVAGCAHADDQTVRTQFQIAGVTLVAGLVLGAVAGYFFAFPPEKAPAVAFTGNGLRGSF